MPISPNIKNYAIGKGSVYFTPVDGTRRHMGNATVFETEPVVEKLEHFSSMTGIKTKDYSPVIQMSITLRLTLEEWNYHNVAMALLGEAAVNSDGDIEIDIGAVTEIIGQVEFIGANTIGPKWNVTLPSVSLAPAGALAFITDEWGALEMEGEVLSVNGSFGTATQIIAADETETFTETELEISE